MSETVLIQVNGMPLTVPADTSVACAVFLAGEFRFRTSVTGQARAPLCGMGICFECRVSIDGRGHCRSCQISVRNGMVVETS